jgi:ribosomal protein L29
MMSTEEIREMTDEQILERVGSSGRSCSGCGSGVHDGAGEPAAPKTIRRDIARMKTILRERELQGGEA